MMKRISNQHGTIFILSLWALGLLTVFSVNIGIHIRQKFILLSRLERRSMLRMVTDSAVKRAMAVVYGKDTGEEPQTALQKQLLLHGNPDDFQNVPCGAGIFSVQYRDYDHANGQWLTRYGLVDEDRKINLNHAGHKIISRLFMFALDLEEDESGSLAAAIEDWRRYGKTEIVGFFSDEYYDQLDDPYPEKKGDFEHLEELRLVKGISASVYEKLLSYVTVYGPGRVNVNTAPRPVLRALGLSEGLADTILAIRKGPDGIVLSEDDVVFESMGMFQSLLTQFISLSEQDKGQLSELSGKNMLGFSATHYRVDVVARMQQGPDRRSSTCIFAKDNGKIVYWRE